MKSQLKKKTKRKKTIAMPKEKNIKKVKIKKYLKICKNIARSNSLILNMKI